MDSAAPRSNPWLALGILLTIYIFNFADRYLLTGLVGPIKAEFGVGDNFMGLLMGPAFVVLYVLMGVPFARLADRSSRIRIIAAGCVIWSLATVATGLASGPVSLALARVGVGVGEAAFVAPAYSLLSDYFKPERRGLAFAILGLATYIGQILGQAGGPAIAAASDWRTAFFAIGLPGVALGLVALVLVREPPREGQVAGEPQVIIPLAALLARLLRTPSFVLMAIGCGLGIMSGISFGSWGPELFARSYAIGDVEAKTAFALNFGLSGLVGMLCFGVLADRMSKRSRAWPARLSAMALGAATLLVIATVWAPTFAIAKWLAVPCGLLGGGWSVGLFAALQYMLPSTYRASATALFVAVTTLLGYFIGPWLTGALSQNFGDDAASLQLALTIIVPVGVIASVLAFLAASRLETGRIALAEAQ